MFKYFINWLSNIYKDDEEYSNQEYLDNVVKKCENESCEMFATFQKENFDYILGLMLNKANFNINMFIKNKELFFTPLNILKLEKKLQEFTKTNGKIIISTFEGKTNNYFLNLEKLYSNNFEYIPLKCTNANEVHSFLIVDNKSYMIEDRTWNNLYNDEKLLKAECNFLDYSKSNDLTIKFKSYITNRGK